MGLKSYPKVYFRLIVAGFSIVMALGLTKSFLPIMAAELDTTGALVGLVTSSWFLTRVFVEIPSGLIIGKLGRRNLLITGLLLSALAPIISVFSNNIYLLIVGMTIWGFGAGLFFMCSTVAVFDLFEIGKRGRAMGALQAVESIGSFLGAPIGAIIAGIWGFPPVFSVASLVVFLGLLATFASREIRNLDTNPSNDLRFKPFEDTVTCLRNWRLVAVSFINMSRMLVIQGIFFTVLQLHLNMELNMSIEAIGLVLGGRTGGIVMATMASGFVGERTGSKPLIAASLLTEACCLCLFPTVTSFEQVLLLATVGGIASGFIFTSLMVMMSELVAPYMRGVALGIYRTFMDVGGIVGPIMFAFLYTFYDAWTAFVAAALVFLLCVLVLAIVRHEPNDRSRPALNS